MIAGEHRLALPPGFQLGKYRFKEVLGVGGFGITYLAEDGSLGRRVAIKELLPNDIATRLDGSAVVAKTKSEEDNLAWARDRFVKEGRALAACEHPNVVHVYEMIEANGTAYMVTKFEDGRSFAEWLKEIDGAPTEMELRAVLVPLLAGLEKVHQSGFLHRDLKPENIYLTDDGRPILLDFGSARQAVSDRTTSLTSIVTSGYAPFEQYHEDGKQGAWTDLYALGAVMYRAIHGKKPPEATRRLKDDPCLKLAKEYAGKYSAPFLAAIDKALAVEPGKRPQSVADWRPMLGAAPTKEQIIVPPWWRPLVERGRRVIRLAKAKPLHAAGVAAGVLVLGVLAWKLMQPTPAPTIAAIAPTPTPALIAVESPTPAPVATPVPLIAETTVPPTPAPSTATPSPKSATVWETFKIPPAATPAPDAPVQVRLGPKAAQRWENSLGMVLTPVPGTDYHMDARETRRGDFEAFVRATGYNATEGVRSWTSKGFQAQGGSWVNPGFAQTPLHPAVGTNAYDALAFCQWLTAKERAERRIDDKLEYRLPTAAEWSAAAGQSRFPWGDDWPPTIGAGNFAGEEAKKTLGGSRVISGYRDNFATTSPAGTFQANAFGFYDLGGNALELCGSWDQRDPTTIVARGGSWLTFDPNLVQLAMPETVAPHERYLTVGFRCVLAPVAVPVAFVLPPLVPLPEPALAEDATVDPRLVGIWEARATNPAGGTITFRWEQEPDGRYTLAGGPITDAGTLTAGDGRIRQQSESTGVKTTVSYRFKSTTQLVTNGPLGEATWRRVNSRTTAMRAVEDGTEEKSDGTQASTRRRTSDPQSRTKSSGSSIERRARDVGNSLRRRFGF